MNKEINTNKYDLCTVSACRKTASYEFYLIYDSMKYSDIMEWGLQSNVLSASLISN